MKLVERLTEERLTQTLLKRGKGSWGSGSFGQHLHIVGGDGVRWKV
jgi:hypothetical protein